MASSSLSSAVLSWLSRHAPAAPFFRRRGGGAPGPAPDLGRLALPPEIILALAEHLGTPSLLCLALTCRALYRLCFPAGAPASPVLGGEGSSGDRQELLLLLERDMAGAYYFCHRCVKLHPWRASWFNQYEWPRPPARSYDWGLLFNATCVMEDEFRADESYWIPYPVARVVMNHHLYGLGAPGGRGGGGDPARTLERRRAMRTSSGVDVAQDVRARIVDDQLLLSMRLTLSHAEGSARLLRQYVDRSAPWVCYYHLPLTRGWSGCVKRDERRIPEMAMDCGLQPPGFFTPCAGSLRSCPICMTDYCIDIAWRGAARGWVIEVVTYIQLGSARSPSDWEWAVATSYAGNGVRRSRRSPPAGRPGSVRHLWSRGDETVLEPAGEWVAEAHLI